MGLNFVVSWMVFKLRIRFKWVDFLLFFYFLSWDRRFLVIWYEKWYFLLEFSKFDDDDSGGGDLEEEKEGEEEDEEEVKESC